MSTIFGSSEKHILSDEEQDPIVTELRMLNYRYVRLYFNQQKDCFVLFNGWKDPNWTDVKTVRLGLDSDEKHVREVVFGNNDIDIEQKSIPRLLVDEVFHPFYVFQIASLLLWSLDEYYYYAIAIFLMSFGSITSTLIETRATMKRLREISRFECDVQGRYVSSSELVPGDIYEASDPNLAQFPSDGLLLSGDCIVNESMLTGESVPVSKIPATEDALQDIDLGAPTVSPEIAKHFLFCGTKIIRARRPQDDQGGDAVALALVVRTGFSTTKGSLVRSMLFPKPSGFKFYRDSFRYVGVMAMVAMLGFVVSLVNFIRLDLAWHLIIVRALDVITIAVPPALPATLSIGTSFALARLKKKQIFCISPQRVNVGGKVDIMCFDKTGTLTEDGLDILGVRVASGGRFSDIMGDVSALYKAINADLKSSFAAALFTMATCHSLRVVDEQLVGDPLELRMVEFSGWSFDEGKQSSTEPDEDEQGSLSPSVARPPTEYKQHLDAADNQSGSTPLPLSAEVDVSLPFDISNLRNYSLAISGDAFRWLVDFAEPHVLQRMLVNGKIYARMSPDEKHELVEKLQSMDYCVGFCGDGANDCGALKAADVGISLSEAEASVAAPFTSRNFDIGCCPEVIREGRAALVTSFSCFKYMSLYSAIQFTSVSFLYATASNLGDFQFLFIDLLLILPIAIFNWVLDSGYLPHALIRIGIRRQLQERLNAIKSASLTAEYERKLSFIQQLRTRPIAVETATANKQHYEVGTGVLAACLGPRMKYSCCLYPQGQETLAQAEVAMLRTYVDKADLRDGMSILDLGCGWGSGALYFAEVLPGAKITAFSNSKTQKDYIDAKAQEKGLTNLTVITGNVVDYEFEAKSFDRVVSIELFEHMKNYELLMAKVARALKPGGKLFVHIFAHRTTPYDYEEGWMTTHFFTGGTMPSADLLLYFQSDLHIREQWWVNGAHYSKTCEDWLSKMLANKQAIWPHLVETYGEQDAHVWYNRWQIFYMACSELFAYEGGDTWGIAHYLFEKPEV
ncbi:hypothetical protein ACHAQA_008397 [Verticillium albo-atrum]